jgi:predicted RNase H-like nuclease/ppGpp synthetase/RelA/SpoT-type nucleotidyltranferase
VHHIGIDLAWGERRPTGVAVLDEDGRLVHVATVTTDDEIVESLAAYTDGPCLVAIDAPLVVTNATGSRPAEKALAADFRSYEAAPHPSNTGKPEFASGNTRGARLCQRLGLDLNPRSGRDRRAIEVYPHPATIVLFGLPRTLKYKHKQGRDLDLLRAELLTLVGLVETVVETGAQGAVLRAQVETAGRKSELRVVEDQVDAVLCAYIGRFADLEPERTTTYGDLETGYIVTPALPSDDVDDPVRRAVQEYAAEQSALIEAGEQAIALVTSILDEAGINYLSVTGRTKGVPSFAEKAARTIDGQLLYPDPMRDITDQIGVRIITYVHSDVAAVAGLLSDQVVVHDDRDMGQETASEGRFGYASRHLLIGLDSAREGQPPYSQLTGRMAQVQIRTVLQHAWAEFEHDIRYKGTVPAEHAPDFDRRFTLAAGLLELADREFSTIREALRPGDRGPAAESDDPRLEPRELAAFLAGQYADAGWSRTDHYAWISGLLLELGITSLDELSEALRPTDDLALNEKMDYRYPPGAVRRLDDALLAAFGDSYVELHGNEHRVPLLKQRLAKMRD